MMLNIFKVCDEVFLIVHILWNKFQMFSKKKTENILSCRQTFAVQHDSFSGLRVNVYLCKIFFQMFILIILLMSSTDVKCLSVDKHLTFVLLINIIINITSVLLINNIINMNI